MRYYISHSFPVVSSSTVAGNMNVSLHLNVRQMQQAVLFFILKEGRMINLWTR